MPARMLVKLSSAKPTNAKKSPTPGWPEWGFEVLEVGPNMGLSFFLLDS